MKVILGLIVIACMLAAVSAQSSDCVRRASELASCISSAGNPSGAADFCNNCASRLISYYNDCTGGAGVDAVRRGKLNKPLCVYATSAVQYSCTSAYYTIVLTGGKQ